MVYAKFSKILVRTGIPDVCLFLFILCLLLCLLIFRQNVSLQLIRFLGESVSKARLLTLHNAAPHSCFSLGTVPVAGPSHLVRAAPSLTACGKGLPGVPSLTTFCTTQADESPDVQRWQQQLDRGHVCLPARGGPSLSPGPGSEGPEVTAAHKPALLLPPASAVSIILGWERVSLPRQ